MWSVILLFSIKRKLDTTLTTVLMPHVSAPEIRPVLLRKLPLILAKLKDKLCLNIISCVD